MNLNSLVAAVNKLVDDKLNKFKVEYKQYLAKTGINKQAKINDPSGGTTIDAEARTAIQSIIDALEENGITKK